MEEGRPGKPEEGQGTSEVHHPLELQAVQDKHEDSLVGSKEARSHHQTTTPLFSQA